MKRLKKVKINQKSQYILTFSIIVDLFQSIWINLDLFDIFGTDFNGFCRDELKYGFKFGYKKFD